MDKQDYFPTRRTPNGKDIPIGDAAEALRKPLHSSQDYPNWVCKNSCGRTFKEDYIGNRCPDCNAPLIRWIKYEQKK